MASTIYDSVDLCRIRVSLLTTGGAPLTWASNGYVSDAAINLGIKITTEAGDDITQKNGCGTICATLQSPDQMKGIALSADLCILDAYLEEFLCGSQTISSGANAIGSRFAAVGSSPTPVCFEGWSKAWQTDHQATNAFTSPNPTYIHWVFPYTRWVLGDRTLEHGIDVWPVNGVGSENTAITVDGPFNDWPSAVAASGGMPRLGGWFFDGTIPTASTSKIAVTSAAS